MFEFLKLQYEMGRVAKEVLQNLIGKRITQNEFDLIVGEEG